MSFLRSFPREIESARPLVLRAARGKGLKSDDAQDATQNVLCTALTSEIKYEPPILNALTTILTSEVNRFRNLHKREKNHGIGTESHWERLLRSRESGVGSRVADLRAELKELIEDTKLTWMQAFCLTSWLIDEWSQTEIANALGCSEQNVSYHCGQAMQRIRHGQEHGVIRVSPGLFKRLSRHAVFRAPQKTGAGLSNLSPRQRRANLK